MLPGVAAPGLNTLGCRDIILSIAYQVIPPQLAAGQLFLRKRNRS